VPEHYPREAALRDHYERHPHYASSISAENLTAVMAGLGIAVRPGSRALDLGCGDGRFCAWLAERGARVVGVDCAGSRIVLAAERCRGLQGVKLIQDDLHHALGDLGYFDLIAVFEVLEHLEEPRRVVERCLTRLEPGGTMVGSVPIDHPYPAHLQVYRTVAEVRDQLRPTTVHVDRGHFWCRWEHEDVR